MQYRLYIAVNRDLFCDPDKILHSARDFYTLSAEGEDKTIERIKSFYPYASGEVIGDTPRSGKRASVFLRAGRSDRALAELNRIIALQKPKNPISVTSGREFIFKSFASGEQVTAFLSGNVNSYLYSDGYSEHPDETEVDASEQRVDKFCMAQYGELIALKKRLDIKMPVDDLMCVQNYFISESREPTYVELKIIDSFFSESFRHTTFETVLDSVMTSDENVKAAWQRYRMKRRGKTPTLSDITVTASEELLAPMIAGMDSQEEAFETKKVFHATKKLLGIKLDTEDKNEKLLLIFKSESHNRSVTAAPYDGAAGAVGCALKDLFCAFGKAYDSYRVVGRGRTELSRKKAMLSAAGYSETASQLGIPCSKCKETVSRIYNDKQLEVCALLAVTNAENTFQMLRMVPQRGDRIYLIGSATGSDGLNSAHRSLKREGSVGEYIPVTDSGMLSAMQRLFARDEFAKLVVAINDVGSGGIVCAMGEMVDGAEIDLAAVRMKHSGMSCADIVLSETNERMLVCIRSVNSSMLEGYCRAEGLDADCIATVTDDGRFTVLDRGDKVVSLTRDFLLHGGAEKHLSAKIDKAAPLPENEAVAAVKEPVITADDTKRMFGLKVTNDYSAGYICSAKQVRRTRCELSHSFNIAACESTADVDSGDLMYDFSLRTARNGSMHIIGKDGEKIYTALSCATLPEISRIDPFKGAFLTVTEAYLKLVAAGCAERDIYLSLQEYLPRHKNSSVRLGVSVASMLGVYEAQTMLCVPSIGGRVTIGSGVKDEETASSVTAFAFCTCSKKNIIPSAFTAVGSKIVLLSPAVSKESGLPSGEAMVTTVRKFRELQKFGAVRSAAVVNARNVCTVLMEMCRHGKKGVAFDPESDIDTLFSNSYCSIVAEVAPDTALPENATLIGYVTSDGYFSRPNDRFSVTGIGVSGVKRRECKRPKDYLYINKLRDQYGRVKLCYGNKIRVLIPDTGFTVSQDGIAGLFGYFGAEVKLLPTKDGNLSELTKAIKKTDILWLPDSLGDSALTCAVLSDKKVREAIDQLIERGGLIYGCGSSVEALAVCGLLDVDRMRLSFVRDRSERINEAVDIRVVSRLTPFMRHAEVDLHYRGYITGNRLRMLVVPEYADELARKGRIITQYGESCNLLGSTEGIDSVCSSNGQVFGQLSRALSSKNALPIVKSALGYFSSYRTYDGEFANE